MTSADGRRQTADGRSVQVDRAHSRARSDGSLWTWLRAPLMLVLLAIVGILAMEPYVTWNDAPHSYGGFSTDRAMVDLEALTRTPRPIGAAQFARDYITEQIEALGVHATVQRVMAVRESQSGPVRAAIVENILARVRGTGDGRAVLLVAHYDSVPNSRGAADNGAAVAALIETLRCLEALPPLRNDVVLLMTDGEEVGLMGARGFIAEHPWAKDVRLIVNLDARGAGGPSLMFETAPGTGGLMRAFAAVAPRPLAPGYAEDAYRLLPNSTDFSVLRQLGQPGFNFAFIHQSRVYHSPLDTPKQLDRHSLWHHGVQTLALTRHFGNVDLERQPSQVVTHFNLPVVGLVVYPRTVTLVLGGLVVLLAAACVRLARARSGVRWTRAGLALLLLPLNLVLAAAVVFALDGFARSAFDLNEDAGNIIACVLVSSSVAVAMSLLWVGRAGRPAVAVAAMVWWGLLTALALVFLPASSYLLVLPGLAAVPGLAVLARTSTADASVRASAAIFLSVVPALLFWIPTAALIGAALGSGVPLAALTALLVSLLAPQLVAVVHSPRLLASAPLVSALAAGACIVGDVGERVGEPASMRATSVLYALDASRDRAMWVSFDRESDPAMSRFFGHDARREPMPEFFDGTARPLLVADAPMLPLVAPTATVLEDHLTESGRRLRIRLRSPRGGQTIRLELRSSAAVRLLSVGDVELTAATGSSQPQALAVYALPPEGVEIRVSVDGAGPLDINLVDVAYGLPAAGREWPMRPAETIPARFVPTDLSLVRYAQTLE